MSYRVIITKFVECLNSRMQWKLKEIEVGRKTGFQSWEEANEFANRITKKDDNLMFNVQAYKNEVIT